MAKKLTEQQQAFLKYLGEEANGKIRPAMDMAGYSKNTSPSEIISALQDEIIQIAKDKLTGGSVKAVEHMLALLDNPNHLNARTTISVAKEILDRVGIVKQEQITVNNETGGVVILPPKRQSDVND